MSRIFGRPAFDCTIGQHFPVFRGFSPECPLLGAPLPRWASSRSPERTPTGGGLCCTRVVVRAWAKFETQAPSPKWHRLDINHCTTRVKNEPLGESYLPLVALFHNRQYFICTIHRWQDPLPCAMVIAKQTPCATLCNVETTTESSRGRGAADISELFTCRAQYLIPTMTSKIFFGQPHRRFDALVLKPLYE